MAKFRHSSKIVMDSKHIVPILILGLLTGCIDVFQKPNVIAGPDAASIKLAESASSVSNSLGEIAGIQRVTTAPVINRAISPPDNYDMNGLVSVDWSGPIGPLVDKIAYLSGYQYEAIGEPPAIPIIVSVNAKDTPLAYILRNADFQAGSRANIIVIPCRRIIELRYGSAQDDNLQVFGSGMNMGSVRYYGVHHRYHRKYYNSVQNTGNDQSTDYGQHYNIPQNEVVQNYGSSTN